MTSLLPMDTSSKDPKSEQLELEMELEGKQESKSPHATPTRIPHPTPTTTSDGNGDGGSSEHNVSLRRSASMRLRGTKSSTPQSSSCLPAGAFSPRAKLVESSSPSSLRSASVGTHSERRLTRNRSWSNLGQHNTTSKSLQDTSTSASTAISTAGELALCSDTQCLEIRERQQQQESESNHGLDMSASKSRNMSLQLNGGSAETTGKTNSTSTSTPKTPKTPSTPALNGGASGVHSCVRDSHCARSSSSKSLRKPEATATKLSTVPETKISPKTPPVTPDSPSTYLDDDLDSMYSFATTTSGRSTMSCEHPYVARNGTTFSGRKMKYVVHCSNYAGQVGPEYLTPTQRAQRQIRRLKELLCIARQDLEAKDTEIMRLTREVVELRLFKASLSSPEERSASSDAVTVREAELKTSQDVSPIVDMVDEAKCSPRHLVRLQQQQQQQQHQQLQAMQMSAEMQSSYADSGHFEDLTMSSVHSKDSQTQSEITPEAAASSLENYELQRQELIRMYEQRIEELIRTQDSASSDMKRSHNDKVEALLQKLAECNTRYSDIVPDYEHAKQRIRELEKQLEDLQRKLIEHEEKQNKMYLHMYQQGQEAERISRADQALELAQRQPDSKVSINELLQQLQSTQDELENIRTIYRRLLEAQKNRTHVDPEVTLQFLKSAIFYFLTDKENSQGHLQAIESILEFTDDEKQKINQARSPNVAKFIVLCFVQLNEFIFNFIFCQK